MARTCWSECLVLWLLFVSTACAQSECGSRNQTQPTCLSGVSSWSSIRTESTSNISSNTRPPYIQPTENTQSCNIYGPLCQTGSITVEVDLTTTTTTTSLACSEYLSAQSEANQEVLASTSIYASGYVDGWNRRFGQSPECQAYQGRYGSYPDWKPDPYLIDLFSRCDNPSQEFQEWDPFVPPGDVLKYKPERYAACCGICHFSANEVRILYFPKQNSTCSRSAHNNMTLPESLGPLSLGVSIPTTSVYKGVTMTSPSIYVELVGPATVNDFCGIVYPVLPSAIVAVNPANLTTIFIANVTDGQTYTPNPLSHTMQYKSLNVDDLECPTFGLNNATPNKEGLFTFGPPYLPVIDPPMPLLHARPEWLSKCGDYVNTIDYQFMYSCFIPDPPHAITRQPELAIPQTTPPVNDPAPVDPKPGSKPPTMFIPSTASALVSPGPAPTPPPSQNGGEGDHDKDSDQGHNDAEAGQGSPAKKSGEVSGGSVGGGDGQNRLPTHSPDPKNDEDSSSENTTPKEPTPHDDLDPHDPNSAQHPPSFSSIPNLILKVLGLDTFSPTDLPASPRATTISLPIPSPKGGLDPDQNSGPDSNFNLESDYTPEQVTVLNGQVIQVPKPSLVVIDGTTLSKPEEGVQPTAKATVGGWIYKINAKGDLVISPVDDTGSNNAGEDRSGDEPGSRGNGNGNGKSNTGDDTEREIGKETTDGGSDSNKAASETDSPTSTNAASRNIGNKEKCIMTFTSCTWVTIWAYMGLV